MRLNRIWPKDPRNAIFLKSWVFKDVKYDIPMCQYHSTRPQPIQLVPTMQKKLFTLSFQPKFLKIWFTKVAATSSKSYVPANFFFSWSGGPRGMFWATEPHLEHPFWSLFLPKEPDRGWKSDVMTFSWKSEWKPSKRQFWHQRISNIFFPLKFLCELISSL